MSESYDGLDALAAHANGAANDPEPAVPRTVPDLSDPTAFVLDLSAETPFFASEGRVKLRIGKKVLPFLIRSVPHDVLQRAMQTCKPPVPKILDKDTRKLVDDVESPIYQDWEQSYAYVKAVLGLTHIVLRDKQGAVVWQSTGQASDDAEAFFAVQTIERHDKIHWGTKFRRAVQALKDMQMTLGHIVALSTAIDDLSRVDDAETAEDLLGN